METGMANRIIAPFVPGKMMAKKQNHAVRLAEILRTRTVRRAAEYSTTEGETL